MKKGIKRTIAGGAIAVMLLGNAFSAQAAGPQNDAAGWWWEEDDGSRAVNTWKELNGNKYYFGTDGYMCVNGWIEIPYSYVYTDPYTGMSFPMEDYDCYCFDASGALVTSGNWEGGAVMPDGRLVIDDGPYCMEQQLSYWRDRTAVADAPAGAAWQNVTEADGTYLGTLPWKYQMVRQLTDTLSYAYGTYTMDFQLPANYAEQCPNPLMTTAIHYVCVDAWEDGNWQAQWYVDDNYVMHITATFAP